MEALAEKRPPGRPPKDTLNLTGRGLESVQFYQGVQLIGVVKTGLHTKHDKCDLRLIGPGVYVKFTAGGTSRELIVPFANVKFVLLAEGEE